MSATLPSAVPEMPVQDVSKAATYCQQRLGFHRDWGEEGIGQVSRGNCCLFLTDPGSPGRGRMACTRTRSRFSISVGSPSDFSRRDKRTTSRTSARLWN